MEICRFKVYIQKDSLGLLVTLLHISTKTADDIVENNDQVILAWLEAETF